MLRLKFLDYDARDNDDEEDDGTRYLYIETDKTILQDVDVEDIEIENSKWTANGFCTMKIGEFRAIDTYSFDKRRHQRDVESKD